MSKADDLYYQYRRKLNQENGTRQGYRREKSSGQGTRNERYINEVLGGQGQPVQPSQASTSAPKTRQQILQEYRNGIQKSAAPSTTSSPVYSPDGAFFPKKNPYEGTTTKRPNPFEKVPYSDPLARAFNEKTGWRDPGMQALYELAERVQAQNNRKNFASNDPIGRMGAGNIDLYNRPQYRQPDGSLSTVNSISIGTDEGEVLIPTIGRDAKGNPVQWTDDEAIENFFRTGEYLGKFKTPEEADRYAEMLHNQQEAYYGADGRQQKITPASVFRSGPLADANKAPRSRSFEAANRAAEAEKEAAEQSAAGIQFDRSEAVKRRQSNIIPPKTIESITDQYDMRPSYMRQQGDLPAAQDDRTRKALEQIYNSPIRVNQDNPVVEGFVRGTGIPSIINAGVNAVGAATGDQDMRNRINREYASYLQQSQQLAENNPIAYGAGNIAGNIALMSGIGKVIGAGAGAINTASTAGRAALRMGASALNFAATTAIQEAGAAAGGFTTPDNYARDVLVSGGAGMASAVASMAVAGGLEKVLSKSGLGGQYVFLDYLKNLSSATAGAGARVGVDYAAINKAPTDAFRQAFISNHPGSTEEDIQKAYVNSLRQRAGEQFVTAFVFNLISSYMDTLRSTERAHYDLQREYDELEQVMEAYGKNPPRNAAEAAQWANDVHTEAGRVRSRLNNGYYAGQQDKIDKILPLLDEIDERANQWASNYSGISGPAPAPEPTPEFVQEIGAAMQQGAENPPAVINPDEPIQAPAAREAQPSTTDLLSEIANAPMPAEEEPIVPPAVNTNVDNINADVDTSAPAQLLENSEETSVAEDRRKKAQEWFDEIDTFINEEQEIHAATEEDLPTTKENVPTTEVAAPTTETTVPTTEKVAPVEEKAPQEIVQQEEKPAEKPAERTTTDMLQEIANTEYEAPATEEAPAVEQPRAEEIQQAPAVEAQREPEPPAPVSEAPAPLNETPAESKIESGKTFKVKDGDVQVAAKRIFREGKQRGGVPTASLIGEDGRQYFTDGTMAVVLNNKVEGIGVQGETGTWKNEDAARYIKIMDQTIEDSRGQKDTLSVDYPSFHKAIGSLSKTNMTEYNGKKLFSFDGKQYFDFGPSAQMVNASKMETALRMIENPEVHYSNGIKIPIYIKGDNGEAVVFGVNYPKAKQFLYGDKQRQEAQKPVEKAPEAPKPAVTKKEFATEEASKLSADLFQRKRVDQNGLRYTIRGDDGEFFGSIERIGAGNVKNARDTIYNVGPKATLQEVADDLAEVAKKNGFLTVNEEKASEPKQPEVTNENTTVAKTGTPQAQIAESVKAMLESGKDFTVDWLYKEANKAFGGTMAEGAYTVKDAYDGMELAINKYLMDADFVKNGNGSLADAKKTLTSILRVMSKIPAQNKRTEEQELFQQYSTPPNIAYTAARMANINKDDIVLEPSAGIGGLALWGKAWGAKVYGNELSERRLAFLNELGLDGTFNENAEQINNVLPDNIKPTVVIMNPPFSATAGRMTKNATKNATRHITQALDRLEDGGRLVAILGRGMSNDSPSFKKWWDEIRKDYTVRANVRIDGSNYKKYGTTFDDQLVVIDKIGPQTGETITGEYKNLSELLTDLEGVRDARTQLEGRNTEPDRLVSGSGNDSGQRDGGALPGGRNSGRNGGVAAGQRSGIDSGTDGGSGRNRRGVLGGSNTSDNGRPGTAGERPESGVSGGRTGESGSGNAGQTDNTVRLVPGSVQRPRVKKINLDSTFTEYVPAKVNIAGAKPHPGRLAESAAMGAVSPPDATYTPHLSQSLIDTGRPSIAQLENVVYAGQAHSQMLPDGSRKGYFIGDGTGVGKGIQIASIILDNFNQGRRKALWISKGQNLYEDAQRDWKDLGGNPKEIYSLSKVKKTNDIPYGDGILFGTYDTLGSRKEEGIKKLQKWLGKDFDGVIAMDEAHGMAGGAPVKGSRGTKKPSQKALWGIELQKAFPNARIVYASATGASSPENMVYLQRLGLWGKGTAFTDFNDFYSKISSGGLAAMELVARDMKAMGVYLARSISYDDVTYDTLEHDLTPIQTDIYNKMSDAWQVVLRDINKALKITGGDKPGGGKGAAYSAFWGSLQRFYNQIITSMSMPSVIEDIKAELANGRSVVIQLTKTNAAQADRAIEKNAMEGGDLEDLDLTPSEELINMVKKSFPVQAYEEYTDDEGNVRVRPVVDSNGKPVEDKKAVELREQLIAEIGQMQVPDGPLEMLLDAFGTDQVAEVTGRTRRVVYKKQADGSMKRVIEKRGDAASLADANAFQDGKKRILVFSEKGGTGKSYHADLRAKNQQQRVHYLLQPGWKADAAIQGLGRTHRTNQASAPIYKLVTTNVMGQKRFTSTIARRLNQMGALTKGQRDAGSGVFSEKDNLENPIAMDALASYYKSAPDDMIRKLGIKIKDANGKINESADDLRNISKFLNRILALHVDEQNQVFEDFYAILEQMTDAAVANGTIDRGMENYKADKIELIDEKTVRKDPSGADTKYVQMKTYNKPRLIKYSSLPDIHRGYMGLYRLNDGSVRAVYEIGNFTDQHGTVSRKFWLESPAKWKFSTYVERTLKERATKIPKSEWESAWEEETKKLPQYYESTLHLLTGTLLPIWDKLPESNTRVMRVVTSDGKQYLGRVINPDQIDSVLRGLGANRTVKKYSSDEVFKEVLDNGREAALRDNKWKINRRRVSGEWRLEVTGNNVWSLPKYVPGIITEKINYQNRYFIPTGDKGKEVLAKLLEFNPVLDVRTSSSSEIQQLKGLDSATDYASQWEATRVGDTNKAPMSLNDLIRKVRHDLGLSITTGHIRGKGVRGQFNTHDQGIRTKIANDLPALAHEVGHYFDLEYDIITDGLSNDIKNELYESLRKGLGDTANKYRKDQRDSEGFAEYIRQYMQNREEAAIAYPKLTEYLKSKLSARELAQINNIADEINAYYSLDADNAQSSIRLKEEGGRDFRTIKEKIRDMGDDLYQTWVDSNHSIKRFDDATGGNAYKLASNAAYSDAVAGQLIVGDLTDVNGKYVGPGLKEALHGIDLTDRPTYIAFNEYLVCRHGQTWLEDGKRVFADDRKNSTAFMQRRVAELEAQYDNFKEAADRLVDFVQRFTQTWGVNTGLISQDTLDTWNEKYPNYVPMYRMTEKGTPGAKRGFANQNSPYKRAKGSGLDIMAPVDGIIDQIVRVTNTALRNNVMLEMRRAYQKSPDANANFISPVPAPLRPKTFDMTGTKAQLAGDISDAILSGNIKMSADSAKELGSIIDSINDVMLQFERGRAKDNVVTILVNGKKEYWQVNDKKLLESIGNMNPAKIGGLLEAYANTTRFLTANITGNNPIWSVFSNAPRDLGTFLVYSKSNKDKLSQISNIGIGWINSANTTLRDGKNVDPLYSEYLAMGGGWTSAYSADSDLAKKARKQLTSNKAARTMDTMNPLNWVSFMTDTIEQGPRFATYKLMRESGLSPQEAFFEAMDVTVNFRKAGTMSRQVNKVVPFFNAGLQGADKFARFFSAEDVVGPNRGKVAAGRFGAWAAASVILATLTYALNGRDKEKRKDYSQLSNYTKNNFWCIPLEYGQYFAIPKPRELAALASFAESAMDFTVGKNAHAFDEYYDYATDVFLPGIVSDLAQLPVHAVRDGLDPAVTEFSDRAIGSLGIIGAFHDLSANRDFLGRSIVSSSLEDYEPKDQFTRSTSKAAYWIGRGLNYSPQKIDYLGNQVLGYWWKIQKALFPVGEEYVDRSLGVKNTYFKDNAYSQDLVNWIYDQASKSARKYKSSKDPKDGIRAKNDDNMKKFYGNFYRISKDEPDTPGFVRPRQLVLDMINDYRSFTDNEILTPVQEAVYGVVERTNNMDLLPAVMKTEIKNGDASVQLAPITYVQYQTNYNELYWKYIEDNLDVKASDKQQASVISAAKNIAREKAAKRAALYMGVVHYDAEDSKAEQWVDDGGDLSVWTDFENARKEGKQDGAADWLNKSSLSDEEKWALWELAGWSEKTFDKKVN